MMKTILSNLIQWFSLLYNYETSRKYKYYKSAIFSMWLIKTFKKCGNGIHIQSPANIKGGKYMSIGNNFLSGDRLRLECWDEFAGDKFTPELRIGDNVIMNYNVHIGSINKVIIGNFVLMGSNILITDHQHGNLILNASLRANKGSEAIPT